MWTPDKPTYTHLLATPFQNHWYYYAVSLTPTTICEVRHNQQSSSSQRYWTGLSSGLQKVEFLHIYFVSLFLISLLLFKLHSSRVKWHSDLYHSMYRTSWSCSSYCTAASLWKPISSYSLNSLYFTKTIQLIHFHSVTVIVKRHWWETLNFWAKWHCRGKSEKITPKRKCTLSIGIILMQSIDDCPPSLKWETELVLGISISNVEQYDVRSYHVCV